MSTAYIALLLSTMSQAASRNGSEPSQAQKAEMAAREECQAEAIRSFGTPVPAPGQKVRHLIALGEGRRDFAATSQGSG